MVRILTRVLFLTCRESSFLFCTHKQSPAGAYLLKERKKNYYLERRSLVHGGEFPFSQVPCLKTTAFAPLALPSPLAPTSHQKDIYLHTDDINMPTTPARHNFDLVYVKSPSILLNAF
jgi:hypothetical protein